MCMSMSGYATLKYRFIAFVHPVIFSTQCLFDLIRKSESLTFLSLSPYNLRANDLRRHRRHDNSQFSRSFCIYCACARRHIAVKCQRFSFRAISPQNQQIQNGCLVTYQGSRFCPYKSAILEVAYIVFITKILGRVNFALINPPFCGDTFLTDRIQEHAFYM